MYHKKKQLKFEDYKNCLKAAQVESKKNNLGKNKVDVDVRKEFIKKNKLILKAQQIYK